VVINFSSYSGGAWLKSRPKYWLFWKISQCAPQSFQTNLGTEFQTGQAHPLHIHSKFIILLISQSYSNRESWQRW